jgi:hypothetical protein
MRRRVGERNDPHGLTDVLDIGEALVDFCS